MCAVWQTSLDLMSQDEEERRRQKLLAFKELAERLEDERKMMDYRRQQIEARKEAQVRVCVCVCRYNAMREPSDIFKLAHLRNRLQVRILHTKFVRVPAPT